MKHIEMVGQRFGRLQVMRYVGSDDKHSYWECLCDCGKSIKTTRNSLMLGKTKSCGCYRNELTIARNTTHGCRHTRTYGIWQKMIERCNNPKNKSYINYGGRGIKVCGEWLKFESFLGDMGEAPADMQLDRTDNNKGYEPGNCRWVTSKTNNRNRRNNRHITIDGVSKTVSEWAEEKGIRQNVIGTRLHRGWDERRAVETVSVRVR